MERQSLLIGIFLRSNRTFMELKCMGWRDSRVPGTGSNRTFMELKSQMQIDADDLPKRSNRTFMELKCNWTIGSEETFQSF